MPWISLFFAGLLEVAWAYSMKQSDGFSKLGPSLLTIVFMIMSFGLLAVAMKHLPISTAYVVWTGIGAIGTAIVGFAVLREPVDAAKLICISLIAIGVVGLKVFSKS